MKQNIILLHGALGSKTQVKKLKKLLSNRFNVYSLNFDGHGGKSCNTDFSIDLFTNNTIEFIKENQLKNTHFFGYSMGGYVALNLALKYPNLVNSIITLGTKFNWTKEAAKKEVKMLNPTIIEQKVPHFAEQLKAVHSPNDWKILMQKTANMMLEIANQERLTTADLKQINHRVLIGIGSLDKMVTIEESENAANVLPNAKLKIIDNFYHPIERNNYEILAKIVVEFIE
ncbi:MAG: alpha/beta fold hydrolase [Saprospiraceae bacterium]